MDDWQSLQVAERIVDELFVNGQGERAERLVLMSRDRQDLGGWGRRPIVDIICRHVRALPEDARRSEMSNEHSTAPAKADDAVPVRPASDYLAKTGEWERYVNYLEAQLQAAHESDV